MWSNLVMTAHLQAGQLLLIHGGASGIGTHAIQVANALGARVAVTAGSTAKLDLCRELGADITINYRDEDFVARINAETGGADVIFDIMGASYLDRNIDALATDGQLVVIGMQGGVKGELNIGKLIGKRARVIGTALRGRPLDGPVGKAAIVAAVVESVWPMIADGRVRPIIGATFPIEQAAEAHALLASGEVTGKIVLTVGAEASAPRPTKWRNATAIVSAQFVRLGEEWGAAGSAQRGQRADQLVHLGHRRVVRQADGDGAADVVDTDHVEHPRTGVRRWPASRCRPAAAPPVRRALRAPRSSPPGSAPRAGRSPSPAAATAANPAGSRTARPGRRPRIALRWKVFRDGCRWPTRPDSPGTRCWRRLRRAGRTGAHPSPGGPGRPRAGSSTPT